MTEHLELAREDLAIAESSDAKREAYKRAAEHIAAHRAETDDTWGAIAIALGRGESTVRRIDEWRRSGYEAPTPFLMDPGATDRAARSHTKRWLREADPETVREVIDDLPPERQTIIAQAATPPPSPPDEGTAAEYLRDPAPDPSDYEIDHLVLDLARRAREARDRVRRYGVRTMGDAGDTLRDLESIAADVAELIAAVIEYRNEESLR